MNKIVQIFITPATEHQYEIYYALTEEGTVYCKVMSTRDQRKWVKITDFILPQDDA